MKRQIQIDENARHYIMITKQKTVRYTTSDGQEWPSLELAQERELQHLLNQQLATDDSVIKIIITHKAAVIDILSMTERSRPKARKINGKKVRKIKDDGTAQRLKLCTETEAA